MMRSLLRLFPRAVAFLLSVIVAVMVTVGCSVQSEDAFYEGSWVKVYESLDDVTAETELVVEATALAQEKVRSTAEPGGPSHTTLTTFQVHSVMAPSNTSKVVEVKVRSSDGFSSGEVAQYSIGTRYVLFLKPFVFYPGEDTGSYIAVGQLAAFEIDGQSAERITTRDVAVPSKVALSVLEQRARDVEDR